MGLFDIFSGKSADNLRQAGQTAQGQLYGAGQTAQGAFNTAGANAQRDFSALGGNAGAGYGNVATQAGQTLDQGQAGAMPYYGQARGEYDGLNFAPDQYGSTMLSGYGTLADATGANGAEGLGRARSLFNATPGYQSGIDLAVDQANRIGNARGQAVGNTIGDATKLATTYADQNYGNFVGRLSPFANAPGQQLARDQATAGYGAQLAGARAGIDTGTGQAITNAANTRASTLAGLQGRGIDLSSQLGGQGAQYGFQGQTGGANAMLGAQTAGTQANLQAQEEAEKAQAANNAAAWNAILGGATLAVGAATGAPAGKNPFSAGAGGYTGQGPFINGNPSGGIGSWLGSWGK
jgi:hypothetical protein